MTLTWVGNVYRRWRWKHALRWVTAAEAAEYLAETSSDPAVREEYGKKAIQHYLRALAWHPLEHVYQLPPPRNVGDHIADEQLFPELYVDKIPCILCGTPIPKPPRGASDLGDEGRFCQACRDF